MVRDVTPATPDWRRIDPRIRWYESGESLPALKSARVLINVSPRKSGIWHLSRKTRVILNVPGRRERSESTLALPSATVAAISEGSVDNTLRLLLVTRNEELERELLGLRFLLWRASPGAKAGLGNVVKRTLPLHHEERMKSPVEDL